MQIKEILCIIGGVSVFLVIWVFSMVGGVCLLIGAGFGILLYKPINGFIKNWQRSLYLSEKADMEHRKIELERELEKLKGESQ